MSITKVTSMVVESLDASKLTGTLPALDGSALTGISTVAAGNNISGDITLNGHIIPSAHEAYDIGSPSYKIRDLYLSNNSLMLGDKTISLGDDGKIKLDGDNVSMTTNKVISSPIGEVGDKSGQLNWNSVDSLKLYYCTQDYDGTTPVWKKITLEDF